MPRKTTKEKKIEQFLISLEKTGNKLNACAASRVPPSTLSFWLKNDSVFLEKYESALSNFYVHNHPQFKSLCYQRFVKLAMGKLQTSSRTVTKYYEGGEYSTTETDSDGNPLLNEPSETKIQEVDETIATPRWVFERVLGNSDILGAITTLIEAGVLGEDVAVDMSEIFDDTAERAKQLLINNSPIN